MRVIDRRAFMPVGTDPCPVVVEFPGASLMDFEVLAADQLLMRSCDRSDRINHRLDAPHRRHDERAIGPVRHRCRTRAAIDSMQADAEDRHAAARDDDGRAAVSEIALRCGAPSPRPAVDRGLDD
jgi:hypothetical protein